MISTPRPTIVVAGITSMPRLALAKAATSFARSHLPRSSPSRYGWDLTSIQACSVCRRARSRASECEVSRRLESHVPAVKRDKDGSNLVAKMEQLRGFPFRVDRTGMNRQATEPSRVVADRHFGGPTMGHRSDKTGNRRRERWVLLGVDVGRD